MNLTEATKILKDKGYILESTSNIEKIYSDGNVNTNESSADGFYPKPEVSPIAYAILTNNVKELIALHKNKPTKPKEPWNTKGWYEIAEDKWKYSWQDGYNKEFYEDFSRVVGEIDNQNALRKMLVFEPDFVVCPADFDNIVHKGYDKSIISDLFYNRIINEPDDWEDEENNYFNSDDYGPTPVSNLKTFLE